MANHPVKDHGVLKPPSALSRWAHLLLTGILSSYLLVFSEWLFFITKFSFLSGNSFPANFGIFLISGGSLAAAALIPIGFLAVWDRLPAVRPPKPILQYAAAGLPAFLLTVLLMLLADNFTYTVLHFGIVSTEGWVRGVYAGVFFVVWVYLIVKIGAGIRRTAKASAIPHPLAILALGMLGLTVLAAGVEFRYRPSPDSPSGDGSSGLPDILLIGSDGVNAVDMSLYGYDRETTPFLSGMRSSLLIAENAFTNAPHTAPSIISILTGGHFEESGRLTGEDAYRHLPGILRMAGYFNVEIGVPYYVDAYAMNFQDAFDVVNGRSGNDSPVFRFGQRIGYGESAYFLSVIVERVTDRLGHIFFLRTMQNVYQSVVGTNENVNWDDRGKINQLLDILRTTDQPVFAHVHLMGTHGPVFFPTHRVLSSGSGQSGLSTIDLFDDSVLDFDSYLELLFTALDQSGDLDNTMVVIYTDHNRGYRSDQRIPLLFYFPGGTGSGVWKNNAQNMDIAPTILDYLGIIPPDWMAGLSLLGGEPPARRMIFSGNNPQDIRIVFCARWYRFDGWTGVWFTGRIEGYTGDCAADEIAGAGDLPPEILRYLYDRGISIADVPEDQDAYQEYIGTITRAQLAEFLLLAKYGPTYWPPPGEGIFDDLPASASQAPWIEQVYREGFMDSCSDSPLSFCPQQIVTRGELARFLLQTVEGSDYRPPPAEGIFEDVALTNPLAPWIEELYARGITNGCSIDPLLFCPEEQLSREALTIFIGRAFS